MKALTESKPGGVIPQANNLPHRRHYPAWRVAAKSYAGGGRSI